jgi:hypothetical protein
MEWRQGVKKPLVAGQGKTVPGAVPLRAVGQSVPCGPPWCPAGGKAGGSGRATPGPGLRMRRCGVSAGLQPESVHLVLLVTNAQSEMVQGSAKDGIGAIVE